MAIFFLICAFGFGAAIAHAFFTFAELKTGMAKPDDAQWWQDLYGDKDRKTYLFPRRGPCP